MSCYIKLEDAVEEIARRDTTDGTVKVYSGREVADILEQIQPYDINQEVFKKSKEYVKRFPYVCPYYFTECAERYGEPTLEECRHPFLVDDAGNHLCVLEITEGFDWDKIGESLKIHRGR